MDAKREKLFPDYVLNLIQIIKKSYSSNDSKWRKWHYLPVKKL